MDSSSTPQNSSTVQQSISKVAVAASASLSTNTAPIEGTNASTAMLCTDPNGLCLGTRGNIDSNKAGCYTSLLRLASQLDGFNGSSSLSSNTSSTATPSSGNGSSRGGASSSLLVSIETNQATVVIKECDAHTIVLRVPTPSGGEGGEVSGVTSMGESSMLTKGVDTVDSNREFGSGLRMATNSVGSGKDGGNVVNQI